MSIKQRFLVIFLLTAIFLLPFLSMQNFSPAADEVTHLSSGYSYLKTGEIKLNPQHPPFIKMLAAFPLLFIDIKFNSGNKHLVGPDLKEWKFGQDFLYENGVDRVIFWGRMPMILLSVLLGWYIYKWGKELFGHKAGLAGLFIYAFMPNIIAHSQFVTTDMGLAVFSFITSYYLWRYFQSPTKINILLSGLTLGLALGSKFSAVFLLPIFIVLLLVYNYKKYRNLNWLCRVNLILKIILPIFGLAFLVVWALYFFTSDPFFYWKGLSTVYADHNSSHFYYLKGNFSQDGWWYYFLWAFIIKTPVPFLILLLTATVSYRKNNLNFFNDLFILMPIFLFLFIASWRAHNIGVRYILMIYPFLILFVSGWVASIIQNAKILPGMDKARSIKLSGKMQNESSNLKVLNQTHKFYIFNFIFLVLASWYIYSTISTYPDHLAYFNELVGGPKNGYRHLDDSNLDWGYDLKRLTEYQKKYPELKVAYAWDTYLDAGRLYGIKNMESLNSKNLWVTPAGKYAVSTHAIIRTKLAGKINNNDKINWMDNYKPINRIGQSFFIYEFP